MKNIYIIFSILSFNGMNSYFSILEASVSIGWEFSNALRTNYSIKSHLFWLMLSLTVFMIT